eukprot:1393841-Amorphochlora_amoeboformis.AAC.1
MELLWKLNGRDRKKLGRDREIDNTKGDGGTGVQEKEKEIEREMEKVRQRKKEAKTERKDRGREK